MRKIAEKYLHIGNGGVSFSVTDEGYGPCVKISSSHFGNNNIEQKLFINKADLEELASLFKEAAEYPEYSREYCHAASIERRGECCDSGSCGESAPIAAGPGSAMPNEFLTGAFGYTWNDVFGEQLYASGQCADRTSYQVLRMPVMLYSFAGTIFYNGLVQSFTFANGGVYESVNGDCGVTGVELDPMTGKLLVHWKIPPKPELIKDSATHYITVNYQYDAGL